MCGRFVGFSALETLFKRFPIDVANVQVKPSYNIGPTQEILAIARYEGKNHLVRFHWGFVPFWSKDTSIGSRMINARSETVAKKPSFRTALKSRRCLILADGFYEWAGEKGKKQPMYLTLPNGRPFAFAGLWETWDNRGKEETPYRSATILTREASESVIPIHNRMPVILKPDAYQLWLDRENQDVRLLQDLIQKQVYTKLKSVPVSKQVNSVKVNRPGNIKPVERE
jgi:putative SOS response-associated peptidase YedK